MAPEGRLTVQKVFLEHAETCLDCSDWAAKVLGQKEQVNGMIDNGGREEWIEIEPPWIYIPWTIWYYLYQTNISKLIT